MTFETGITLAAVGVALLNGGLAGANFFRERRLREAIHAAKEAEAAMKLAESQLEVARVVMWAAADGLKRMGQYPIDGERIEANSRRIAHANRDGEERLPVEG